MYYNPKSIMNIFLFRDVRKRFRVTMDTAEEEAILVHLDNGKLLRFKEVKNGLYMWKPLRSVKQNSEKVTCYS